MNFSVFSKSATAGLIDKISSLADLGMAAVELLPIFQCDAQDAPPGRLEPDRSRYADNHKHHEANGEAHRDGTVWNLSWNCGVEGPTDDPAVARLRTRQAKNFFTLTLLALGVPMLLMGDEVRRTQRGNNNTYGQDNDISRVHDGRSRWPDPHGPHRQPESRGPQWLVRRPAIRGRKTCTRFMRKVFRTKSTLPPLSLRLRRWCITPWLAPRPPASLTVSTGLSPAV